MSNEQFPLPPPDIVCVCVCAFQKCTVSLSSMTPSWAPLNLLYTDSICTQWLLLLLNFIRFNNLLKLLMQKSKRFLPSPLDKCKRKCTQNFPHVCPPQYISSFIVHICISSGLYLLFGFKCSPQAHQASPSCPSVNVLTIWPQPSVLLL